MLYDKIELAGFDTETVDGKCTIACLSTTKRVCIYIQPLFEEVLELLMSCRICMTHNLGYDVGAILRLLDCHDEIKIQQMWDGEETQIGIYTLSYIRDKCFVIRRGNRVCRVFDSASLCAYASLECASNEMLGEHKCDDGIDKLLLGSSLQYQLDNLAKVSYYCAYDAILCRKVTEVILQTIREVTGLGAPKKLYSLAYIAACQVMYTQMPDDASQLPPEVELLFEDGYTGARIESLVCGRVRGEIWQHDIISAYPYEMRNIPAYWRGVWEHNDTGHTVLYRIEYDTHTPLWPIRGKTGRSYPIGVNLTAVVTSEMLEFTRKHAFDVRVIDTWSWHPIGEIEYPMRGWVDKVYRLKVDGAGIQKKVAKLLLNSLSGKFQQSGKARGKVRGPLYHPAWAYMLVMKTHFRVLELAYRDWGSVIEICTDGVYASRKLCEGGSVMGDWEVTLVGDEGVWLASGMRMIGGVTTACKGYKGLDLSSLPKSRSIIIPQTGPLSMGRAIRSHKNDEINLWITRYVMLSLDRDGAHVPIDGKYTLHDMLSTCIRRVPKVYFGDKTG